MNTQSGFALLEQLIALSIVAGVCYSVIQLGDQASDLIDSQNIYNCAEADKIFKRFPHVKPGKEYKELCL